MKRMLTQVGTLVLLVGGTAQAFGVPTIFNPSFEDGNVPPNGWSAPAGTADMVSIPGGAPGGGALFLEIGGLGGAVNNSIDQVVDGFTIGCEYALEFSIASQWAGGSGAKVEVSLPSGSSTPAQTFIAPPVPNFALWSTQTYNFVATATSVDIQFKQIPNGFDDVGLDKISLTDLCPVPEPATFALLGLGLAGLGCCRRRKA